MTKKTWLRGGVALAVMSAASWAIAADHLDSPSVQADAATDINDMFAWVDGANVALVMTVFPIADTTSKFSDTTQYVFHTESTATFGVPGTAMNVICTFDAAQTISCWAGDDEYLTGDASNPAGIKSASGKFKVFAGLRDDPFYFNLSGFNDTVSAVVNAAPALMFDNAGCPSLDAATSAALVGLLSSTNGGPAVDFFAGLNTLSIVVSLDKSLVNAGGPIMNVWASTNKAGG